MVINPMVNIFMVIYIYIINHIIHPMVWNSERNDTLQYGFMIGLTHLVKKYGNI